jgi:hypothetical protein
MKLTVNILISILKLPIALVMFVLALIMVVALDADAEHRTKMSGYRTIHYVNSDSTGNLLSAPWEWAFKRTFK